MHTLILSIIAVMALATTCGVGRAAEAPPAVQVFVPGFAVRPLPVKLTNLVNIEYAPDGRLFAAGYDGRIHMLTDTDGDGLEDKITTIWDKTSADYPLGMVVHDKAVYILLKEELVRFVDTDGDGVPDKREVVLKDWDDLKTAKHPLILKRRVDYGMGLAVGPDGSIYIGMGNGAYNNAYMLDTDGKLGAKGKSHYDPKNGRGCVLKFSPDGKKKEILLTGVRYLMSMQFNSHGDLFATDQEGATWLPNGNPFDELLHLQAGRHYGFPPRHPKYLPDVIDEPSVYDYAPQHQSLCGFRFNDGTAFGPSSWKGDALLAGFTRGKLYRTKLAKTDVGYVARNQLIAGLQSLAVDVALSPKGELVVACHTGKPDWGTGPQGAGLLYKLRYSDVNAPLPVAAWSAGPGEFRVAFDKPLDPKELKSLAKQVRITAGKYASAGDRFETTRPGYEVVKQQVAAPRHDVPVLSASVSADGRTLVLNTPTNSEAVNYALTLPGLGRTPPSKGEVVQQPGIDLVSDLTGVAAKWKAASGGESWSGWLPHADLAVASQFTQGSSEHERLFVALKKPGTLTLRGQFDLWQMLQPAIQPNAKLDYERPVETVTVVVEAASPFRLTWGKDEHASAKENTGHRVAVKTTGRENQWLPYSLAITTSEQDAKLRISWFTDADPRPRAFPLRRFLLPWAKPITDKPVTPADRATMPELAGGDRERGRKLFLGEVANCSKCHQVRGEGAKVGPDLSNLVHRDYDSVLRDILEPSAAINPDYLAYTVNLGDGRTFTGIIHADGKDKLTLADGTGKLIEVARKDIDTITPSKVSVMPQDVVKQLKPEQLRDLMTFLLLEPAKTEPRK